MDRMKSQLPESEKGLKKRNKFIAKRNIENTKKKVKRMMLKMGWKGEGLGKNEQGIKHALVHRHIGFGMGVIVNRNLSEQSQINQLNSKK